MYSRRYPGLRGDPPIATIKSGTPSPLKSPERTFVADEGTPTVAVSERTGVAAYAMRESLQWPITSAPARAHASSGDLDAQCRYKSIPPPTDGSTIALSPPAQRRAHLAVPALREEVKRSDSGRYLYPVSIDPVGHSSSGGRVEILRHSYTFAMSLSVSTIPFYPAAIARNVSSSSASESASPPPTLPGPRKWDNYVTFGRAFDSRASAPVAEKVHVRDRERQSLLARLDGDR